MKQIKKIVDECVKSCPNFGSKFRNICYKKCENIKEICQDNCQLNNSEIYGVNNPIYKGTKDFGFRMYFIK